MAQDFGDEVGDELWGMFKRGLKDALKKLAERESARFKEKVTRTFMEERVEWYYDQGLDNGMSRAEARAWAKKMADQDQINVPFGNADDAVAMAKLLRENGIYAKPMQTPDGDGFITLAAEDANTKRFADLMNEYVDGLVEQYRDELINELQYGVDHGVEEKVWDEATPVPGSEEALKDVHPPAVQTRPSHGHDTQETGRVEPEPQSSRGGYTDRIKDRVAEALTVCHTRDELAAYLDRYDIGITESADGHDMFYEGTRDEHGNLNPYNRGSDAAVKASTLSEKYGVDANQTLKTFDGPTPRENPGRAEPEREPVRDHDWMMRKLDDAYHQHGSLEAGREPLERDGIGLIDTPEGTIAYVARRDEQGRLEPFNPEQDHVVAAIPKEHDQLPPGPERDHLRPGFDEHHRENGEIVPASDNNPGGRQGVIPDNRTEAGGQAQTIRSHDGVDTNARTTRVEREGNGTDQPPSEPVREQRKTFGKEPGSAGYKNPKALSLDAKARQAREKVEEYNPQRDRARSADRDMSDKMNPDHGAR